MKKIIDEIDIHSEYRLTLNDYQITIIFNFWIPEPKDFVEGRIWERQDIFNFEISLDRIIEGEFDP